MKVLIVNSTERTGGAAIAARRLMHALRREGLEVSMLCRTKRWPFYCERLCIFMANHFSRKNLWLTDIANCGEDITRRHEFQEADVIHLHWVNQGFLSLGNLEQIFQSGKRIVWTLHDQWPYAGICHYTEECDRFQTHCDNCPLLAKSPNHQITKSPNHDLSYKVFKEKLRIWKKANITFVGCSQWIANFARQSALTQGHRIASIPNAIDHTIFRPIPKEDARTTFGLPKDEKIVLFCSQKVGDERKGAKYLQEAIREIQGIRLVCVGKGGDYEISEEERMAQLYAAADVFVTPSLQDNLPNTIVEAMSCGTPCVGFNVGGIPEMIHHKQDGYVARYRDPKDLAEGIRYVLAHPELGQAAAQYAKDTYNESRVAKQYMNIYNGK